MRSLVPASVAVALALAGATTVVMAQETTSSIRGNVSGNGAAVAGATVTIVHEPSGTTATAVTGQGGTFSASGLRPGGPYKVTVTASGFESTSVDGLYLSLGEPFSLPLALGTGEMELDEALVSGAAVTLAAGPTSSYDRNTIEGVASVNRDIRDIAKRDPYASFNAGNRGIYIAGQNNRTNRFAVDGVRFSDNFGLQVGGLPTTRGPVPLDAVEQLSVKVAPYDVSEGDFQGGSINLVLRSGTNQLTGSAFYTYANDGLTGDKSRGNPIALDFTSKNWGAFLSGPLIENQLFFALSYEGLDETKPAGIGLAGAPSAVPNLTQANIDQVGSIMQATYGYDPLGARTKLPETDKKYTAKLDWNLMEGQRLSWTSIIQRGYLQSTGLGSNSATTPSLNLESYATNEPEKVNSHVLQLNSDWTNTFRTEARINYRDYAKVPSSLGAAGFSQFSVCLDATSTGSTTSCTNGVPRLFMGTEQFSQADVVKQKGYGLELLARLDMGAHALKATAGYNVLEITNTFVQSSLGVYYFDSLADLSAQRANSLSWQYAITGDLQDLDASFSYDQLTLGLQDSWDVMPGLNLTYGLRMDAYYQGGRGVPENVNFFTRHGFTNTTTIDGYDVIQPRFNATWKPLMVPGLTVRGGFGLFNGGGPDVFLGNSFSNAAAFASFPSFTRSAAGANTCTGGVAANVCTAALNGVTGVNLPANATLFNYMAAPATLSTAGTSAMSPDFKLPASWKASVSADYIADLGVLGDGWNFGGELYKSWVKHAEYYTDLRLSQVGVAPDGRPVYRNTFDTTTGSDLLLQATGRGYTSMAVLKASKAWDIGIGAGVSYTRMWSKSLSDMGHSEGQGSTASGSYERVGMSDPNFPAYGNSNYLTRHNWKFNLDFAKAFFGEYKTRASIFGELRTGSPYSLTMRTVNASSRSPLFGTTGRDTRYLLYVPDVSSATADPIVRYNSTATYDAFAAFVQNNDLKQGGIIGKNTKFSPDTFKVDLHLEQELPLPGKVARVSLFADIENLLNLVNNDWGSFRYYPSDVAVVQATCNATVGGACTQYLYSSFAAPTITTPGDARTQVWNARLGFSVKF
jgi:hypothetical protein